MAAPPAVEELKKVTLISSDGGVFEVDVPVAMQLKTIRHLIENECTGGGIPLANVKSHILAMVIDYCKKHVKIIPDDDYGEKIVEEDVRAWDEDFIKVDHDTLFDLLLAANYLDIKELLDLTTQTVANMMKGKTVEQIRHLFHIKNDYTPEEEEEVRRENAWVLER